MIERVRIEDAPAAANDRPGAAEGPPREPEPWGDVVPVGLVGSRRPAVHAREPHDAGRPGDRVDGQRVEAIHPVVRIDDGGVGFPSDAEVEGQVRTDRPVVLEERRQIPAGSIQHLCFTDVHAVGKAEQQAGHAEAGAGAAGQRRRLRGEREGAGDRRPVHLIVDRGPHLESRLQRVTAAHVRQRVDDLVLLDGELPPLVGRGAERRHARNRETGKRLVRHAAQAQFRRSAAVEARRQLVIDPIGVGVAHFIDRRRTERAGVAEVEVVLVPERIGRGVGRRLGEHARL